MKHHCSVGCVRHAKQKEEFVVLNVRIVRRQNGVYDEKVEIMEKSKALSKDFQEHLWDKFYINVGEEEEIGSALGD